MGLLRGWGGRLVLLPISTAPATTPSPGSHHTTTGPCFTRQPAAKQHKPHRQAPAAPAQPDSTSSPPVANQCVSVASASPSALSASCGPDRLAGSNPSRMDSSRSTSACVRLSLISSINGTLYPVLSSNEVAAACQVPRGSVVYLITKGHELYLASQRKDIEP